eukprot:gnl/Trimastix_PCT/1241.p1 GENE.gnl/Trimastix_PCT/1241~~gnl/Trimastix_PCT/1241.p1  ORF type:complete len:382 (-),score=108.45 gnl/Trimastix_PCT/1241:103-1248(-)
METKAENAARFRNELMEPQRRTTQRVAMITGITGQDGSYLADLLLSKELDDGRPMYSMVVGLIRRASSFNTDRLEHLGLDVPHDRFKLEYSDMTDSSNLGNLVRRYQPDEIYNLAAQSHVGVSFSVSEYTCQVDALGVLRILEAIRSNDLMQKTRFYQASTSELYGQVREIPQTETTPFYPRSPYACAKLYGYSIVVNYREAYGIYACNGILFNHESPRRGPTFVTRKITRAVARISKGMQESVSLGNLNALRDWGYAEDYVEGMWRMLQLPAEKAGEYVLATNTSVSVRFFVEEAFKCIGKQITWEGEGVNEIGRDQDGVVRVQVNPVYFRPTEVELLQGDPSKAERELAWMRNATSVKDLVGKMVHADIALVEKGDLRS